MGDSNDGSSSAAQSAQPEANIAETGFVNRFLSKFSSGQSEEQEVIEAPALPEPRQAGLGLLNLRRMRLEEVAVPKAEIVAVPHDISFDDLIEVFRDSGLSRLPVFNGTLDTPLGLVLLKDVALKHGFNGGDKSFDVEPLVRPLLYAPPSMPIGILLQKMQTGRIHMALMIDEYGGVDGLVTIEDLIEQVIGEIEDEHDVADERNWVEESPGCYIVQARTPLDEFEAEIDYELVPEDHDEEIDTLGGLVFVLTGRVPVRGEVVPHPNGTEIDVIDADPRRIKRLRVRLPGVAAAE